MGFLIAAVVVAVIVVVAVVVIATAMASSPEASAETLTEAVTDAEEGMSEGEAGEVCEECAAAAAQAALEEEPEPPIVSHLWQEYHKDAAADAYSGPTGGDAEHTKVAESSDSAGNLQAKETMHLCFLESAVATVEAEVPADAAGKYKMRWWIQDAAGTVIQEHPDFTEASPGTLKTGKYAWRWDGRKRRSAGADEADRVYCEAGAYTSQIEVTDGSDTPVIAAGNCARTITLQGDPYRIYIHVVPKSQAGLEAECNRAGRNNRWLSGSGRRLPSDCWVVVYRGSDNSAGHTVSLAHGAMEPTMDQGIAVPYGRPYKGWIVPDRRSQETQADSIYLEDESSFLAQVADHLEDQETAEGKTWKVYLLNPNAGGPEPTNNDGPYKAGVQIHREIGDTWVGEQSSDGCARGWPEEEGNAVSAERGGVRCSAASFGEYGTGAVRQITTGGPPFANKQTKRSRVEDAHIEDSHSSAELDPPGSGGTPDPDEPLHMQDTFQKGAFGGFLGTEIPQGWVVADEPDRQLRIRATYEEPESDSMYYVYHRAVVFGHSDTVSGTKHTLQAWIPRKVLRTWNGQRRNLRVRGCRIAWYVERRWVENGDNKTEVVHRLGPTGAADDAYAALPSGWIGKVPDKSWDPGSDPQPAGEYYSVLKYRVQLRPYGGDDEDMWEAEGSMADLMSSGDAEIAEEDKTAPDASNRVYIEGRNELKLEGINTAAP